ALSGAGPGVLVIVDSEASLPQAAEAVRSRAMESQPEPELLVCRFLARGAASLVEPALLKGD
ncbi:MAG TPA: hypothetical protein VMV98_10115, partial [Acidobacteriaceae bacterium]|nr:hypothetical protein [Acidobacteriaceae bacterium]